MKELSPQVQNQIAQYQQMAQQLQVVQTQRVQLEARLKEVEGTLSELEKAKDDTPIYRSIGSLLVRAQDRAEVKKELEEQKETLAIRVNALKKQEKMLSERYERLQAQLTEALGTGSGAQSG